MDKQRLAIPVCSSINIKGETKKWLAHHELLVRERHNRRRVATRIVMIRVRRREERFAHRIAESRRAVAQSAVHFVEHDLVEKEREREREKQANTPAAETDTRKRELKRCDIRYAM